MEIIMCLIIIFSREWFSAAVYPHLGRDTHPREEVWVLGSTLKEKEAGQESGFGSDRTLDTASV